MQSVHYSEHIWRICIVLSVKWINRTSFIFDWAMNFSQRLQQAGYMLMDTRCHNKPLFWWQLIFSLSLLYSSLKNYIESQDFIHRLRWINGLSLSQLIESHIKDGHVLNDSEILQPISTQYFKLMYFLMALFGTLHILQYFNDQITFDFE